MLAVEFAAEVWHGWLLFIHVIELLTLLWFDFGEWGVLEFDESGVLEFHTEVWHGWLSIHDVVLLSHSARACVCCGCCYQASTETVNATVVITAAIIKVVLFFMKFYSAVCHYSIFDLMRILI